MHCFVKNVLAFHELHHLWQACTPELRSHASLLCTEDFQSWKFIHVFVLIIFSCSPVICVHVCLGWANWEPSLPAHEQNRGSSTCIMYGCWTLSSSILAESTRDGLAQQTSGRCAVRGHVSWLCADDLVLVNLFTGSVLIILDKLFVHWSLPPK